MDWGGGNPFYHILIVAILTIFQKQYFVFSLCCYRQYRLCIVQRKCELGGFSTSGRDFAVNRAN